MFNHNHKSNLNNLIILLQTTNYSKILLSLSFNATAFNIPVTILPHIKYTPAVGIVLFDRQSSKWKGAIKKVAVGNMQVPSIILLEFCFTAPDKDGGEPGTVVCSTEQR